ncbi:MAG TPA: luciferase family protein [Solirubrobacteraceae bacterium]
MSHWDAVVDEVANELATWPGVHISRREDGAAVVRYEHSELGLLYPDRGVAELPFLESEADELIEHGDAEPAEESGSPESSGVSHDLHGPSDVTEVLELFDRRYRDVRGEDAPYSSQDPDYGRGVPPDQSPLEP